MSVYDDRRADKIYELRQRATLIRRSWNRAYALRQGLRSCPFCIERYPLSNGWHAMPNHSLERCEAGELYFCD